MKSTKFIYNKIIILILAILVFTISALTFNLSAKHQLESELMSYFFDIKAELNNGESEEEILERYSLVEGIHLSFYQDEDTLPYLDSNPQYIDEIDVDSLKNNLSEVYVEHSDSLDETYYYMTAYIPLSKFYVRVGLTETSPIIVSEYFLYIGPWLIVAIGSSMIYFSYRAYKKSLIPIKSQVKKLQNIMHEDLQVEYGDDLKNLAMIVRDSRKELTEQLHLTQIGEQKIKFILDSIGQGLVVVNASYQIVMFNKKASEIFGVSKEEVNLQSMDVLRSAGSIEKNISLVINTLLTKVYYEKIDGRIYKCNIYPINYSWIKVKEKNGAALLMIDVTDEYNSSNMKKEFFANASHELKSPLTSILGYQEMISSGLLSSEEELKEANEKTIKEAKRMRKIILDMLELSSLEKEVLRPIEKLDVYQQMKKIINSLKPQIIEKNIEVNLEKKELNVDMNYDDFEDMARNLLENGIKYNKPNGKLDIILSPEKRTITFKDTGIGISEENLVRIFERFYRVDKARSRQNGGTGLGLAIVKHICNYYNFTIEVNSKINEGSEFTIHLNS
ncbi:MAG: ATP-binding protein [Bacilli bacterium]